MKFYGELLILILLFITNLRVFFTKKARRDPLAVLAPFAFILSILQIFAWGMEILTVLIFLIAFLVLLSNFHALFRYSEQLYIDSYSPLMKFWAILTTTLSAIVILATILFAPVELKTRTNALSKKTNSENFLTISQTKKNYCGSFRAGFKNAGLFSYSNVQLYTFSPLPESSENDSKNESPLILFFPDKRGDTQNYIPYLQFLAQKGCTVMSADFFSNDLKWMHSIEDSKLLRQTACVFHSFKDGQKFMSQREYYSYNILQECNAMMQFVNELFSTDKEFYMVSDVMGNTAISDFAKMNKNRVLGTFFIDSIPEYKTAGYGFVKQTSPLTAFFFNHFVQKKQEKKWQIRDATFYEPKLVVEKTMQTFNLSINE